MKKDDKTNVMRVLDSKKIHYSSRFYTQDSTMTGEDIAALLNEEPSCVFKTLVTQGKTGNYYVFIIPVTQELDLKKAAKSVGEKSVELIAVKDITKITGYVRGGCTPIGMKKQFMTVVHNTAENMELFYISGGKIGVQIRLSPKELVSAIRGKFEDIVLN